MERQAVTTDKKSGITNDANDWAIETMGNAKYPLELFLRVITVSLETQKIVNALPKLDILNWCSRQMTPLLTRGCFFSPLRSQDGPQVVLNHIRAGDTVVVCSIVRLARNNIDLQTLVKDINPEGLTIQFLKEGLTFGHDTESNPSVRWCWPCLMPSVNSSGNW